MTNDLLKNSNKSIRKFILFFLIGLIFTALVPYIAHAASGSSALTVEGEDPFMACTYSQSVAESYWGETGHGIIKLAAAGITTTQVAYLKILANVGTNITDIILLRGDINSGIGAAFTQVRNIVSSKVIPVMQSLGFAMVIVYFLVQLTEHTISQQMTMESWIKMFTKLGVGAVAVEYAPQLFDWIFKFGEALAGMIGALNLPTGGTTAINQATMAKQYYTTLRAAGGSSWIIALVTLVLVSLVMFIFAIIIQICAFVASFARIFEVLLRGSFLPIGLALLSENGWNGGGGRYIKKFIACCCQCAVLILIAQISLTLNAAVVGDITKNVQNSIGSGIGFDSITHALPLAALDIVAVGVMFKSQGIVNDIFGV